MLSFNNCSNSGFDIVDLSSINDSDSSSPPSDALGDQEEEVPDLEPPVNNPPNTESPAPSEPDVVEDSPQPPTSELKANLLYYSYVC